MANAPSMFAVGQETVQMAAKLLDSQQSSLWLQDDKSGEFRCAAHTGYVGDPSAEPLVHRVVDASSGERFLADRTGPFVITPSAVEDYLAPVPGTASRTVAIGPLSDVKGWITVRDPQPDGVHFPQESLLLLAGVCYQASVALQKAKLYRQQRQSAEIANAVLDFGRALSAADGLDEVLERIAERSALILGSPKTSVWLEEPETGDFVPLSSWGYDDDATHDLTGVRVPTDVMRELFGNGDPFVVGPEAIAPLMPRIQGAEEERNDLVYAVAPLTLDGGRRLGAIVAAAPEVSEYRFSERKMRLLVGLAHQAKLAIGNAWNFVTLEQTFLSTVEALANALEAKDEYTSSHARDITDMALGVGEELGLDARSLKRLELGALFHDIGKIGIPSQILLKPGPLTDVERAVVETHPELGDRILAPIARFEDVRPIVKACHERYDGRGYPDGSAGVDIPLEARIIFVCDAYHAMTSDRPYRRALARDEACRRLMESSGTQFDPVVVQTFLSLLERRPELG
jgi:HD-GYP domain-containing protein (c-di-GMP phosphodiesterase class II)